jgi:WD40 repeat protein
MPSGGSSRRMDGLPCQSRISSGCAGLDGTVERCVTIVVAMYEHPRLRCIARALAVCALLACAPVPAAGAQAAPIAPGAIVVTTAPASATNSAQGALWQVSPGGAARRLFATAPGATPSMPVRSAGGAHLAYVVDGQALWQLDAGSSAPRRLYALRAGSYQRLLSPRYQGDDLTFTAGCCAAFAIYRLRANRAQQLASGGVRVLQDWSPDGRQMLYTMDGALWEADAGGAHPHPVGNDAVGAGFFADARYSPDGSHLVASLIPAQGAGEGSHQELVLLHPDGRYLTILTAHVPYAASAPTWSPDGKRIAFLAASGALAGPGRLHDLWVMRYDGADTRNLTRGRLGDVTGAIWGR